MIRFKLKSYSSDELSMRSASCFIVEQIMVMPPHHNVLSSPIIHHPAVKTGQLLGSLALEPVSLLDL